MQFFFQQTFIDSVQKLLKKKSYRDCEAALIKSIFNLSDEDIFSISEAYRLNPSGKNPISKLRVASDRGKSSSYRLYIFVIVKNEKVHFGHLYPKTGPKGKEVLTSSEEREIIKSLLEEAKLKTTREVFLDFGKQKICFVKTKKTVWS